MEKDVDWLENSGHFEYQQSTRKPSLFCQRTKAIHLIYECSSIFYITNRLVRCASLAADFKSLCFVVNSGGAGNNFGMWDFRLADGRGWVWQPCFNSKSQNVTPGLWSLVHNHCVSGSQSCCNIHYLMAGLQSQKWPLAAEKGKTTLCSIPGSTGTTCVHVTISINRKATFWASFAVNCFSFIQVSLVDEQGSGKARPWNRNNFYTENLFTFSRGFFPSRRRDVNSGPQEGAKTSQCTSQGVTYFSIDSIALQDKATELIRNHT